MFKNFQYRLAISPTSLHTIVIIMVVAWIAAPRGTLTPADAANGLWHLLPPFISHTGTINTICAVICAMMGTYILGELNISQVMLRVNSRAISFTFAALFTAAISLHAFTPGTVVMICLLMSYFTLFSSYQIDDSATLTYITFLYLGISMLVYPKIGWMAPVYWLSAYMLRAINLRSVFASILGLITPLWIVGSIAYCMGRFDVFTTMLAQLIHFEWGGYATHTAAETMVVWLCFMVFLIGFGDLRLRLHLDKTRTRIILTQAGIHGFALYLLLLLQPTSLHILLPAVMPVTAIMGGHYVANDSTSLSNIIVWTLSLTIIITYILSSWIL